MKKGENMNRIFLATPDRDETEWLADELSEYGRIIRTIDSLDFFIPQWESVEANVVIFMESIIQSEESFQKLIRRIREDRPATTIMFIYYRDEDDFIQNLTNDGINCINYMDLEPGLVEARLTGVTTPYRPQAHSGSEEQPEETHRQSTDSLSNEGDIEDRQTDHADDDPADKVKSGPGYGAMIGSAAKELGRQLSTTGSRFFDLIENKKNEIREKKKAAINIVQTDELDLDLDPVIERNIKRRTRDRFAGITAVIAVTGVNRGVGCTHTSILIANHLARQGYSVALVEANDSEDFIEIECAYEGVENKKMLRNPSFNIHGVKYIKTVQELNMVQLLTGNYAYIILDLGSYETTAWYNEFLRANIQIIVGSGSEWKQKDIYRFYREQIHQDQSKWKLCVPMANKQVIGDIKKKLPKRKIHSLPFHPDPFVESKEVDSALEDLLKLNQHRKLSLLKKKMQAIFQER